MGARTGQEYIDRLAATRPTVEISGERVTGPSPSTPRSATWSTHVRAALRPAARPSPRRPDLRVADVGRARRHVLPRPAHARGPGHAPQPASRLGRPQPRHARAHGRLPQQRADGAQRGAALVRAGRPGVRRERPPLLREGPRAGPAHDAHADPAAGQPQRSAPAQQIDGRALGAHVVSRTTTASSSAARACSRRSARSPTSCSCSPRRSCAGTPEDAPYSFAFAINCDAPGLRFVCRESLDYGRSPSTTRSAARFEEIDAVVVFDDVHVPWERVFMLGHPELCNGFYTDTQRGRAHDPPGRRRARRAKTEAFLGLISLHDRGDRHRAVPATSRRTSPRSIVALGTLHGAGARRRGRRGAERVRRDDAGVGAAQHGAQLVPARPTQRLPEIVRKFGASGLMALPTEADIAGARARRHRALPAVGDARRAGARAAVPPGLGPRRSPASPAARRSTSTTSSATRCGWRARSAGYDREPYKERVNEFLHRADVEVPA